MVPDMDRRGMNNVIELVLHSCSEIECLIDTHTSLFQRKVLFSNLVTLRLEECQKVTSVFPAASMSGALGKLEEIKIRHCSKLKHIIAEDELEERNIGGGGSNLRPFQNLRVLEVQECESLESIIPVLFAQGLQKLEDIKLRKNPKLTYVFGTQRDYHLSLFEIVSLVEIKLPALRRVRLKSLSDIIDICPENCHPSSPNLKDVECIECPGLGTTTIRSKFNSQRRQQGQTIISRVPGIGEETQEEDEEMAAKPGWLSLVSCLGINQQPQHLKSNEFTKGATCSTSTTFAASLQDFEFDPSTH
ncbi:hypothetical protein L6164_031296 [Bauhinia variegata]|uniref:Uncharacterized protein n=1 Tax=Bauhinia variegata TaxID=167791 RepID=A0ACB9LFF7_BAUVA|nr:hypothetical protein L6164_031296 [Bauhinia variegata]